MSAIDPHGLGMANEWHMASRVRERKRVMKEILDRHEKEEEQRDMKLLSPKVG